MSKAPKRTRPEPTDFPGQHPGEEVALVFRQHPVVMRRQLIYGMLGILLGVVPLMLWPLSNVALKISLFTPVLVFIYWFYYWVGWHYSVYIVTDERLIDIHQKGLFNRKVREVGFDKVQSINYHVKGLQASLLKFGDINVQTYVEEWVLPDIHYPEEIHEEIMAAARNKVASTPPQK